MAYFLERQKRTILTFFQEKRKHINSPIKCKIAKTFFQVKADVQVVGDELRVSGLEAATSLIQNAKNLLNAVILTVKAAFIASTKYRRKENSARPQLVEWRMAQKQQLQPSLPQGNQLSMNGHGGGGRSANGVGIIRRVSERKPKMASHNQFYQ